jgi:Zn-dependent peptidase ImmA (M78 family)/DNA-binding XRE family transcriptional regulator
MIGDRIKQARISAGLSLRQLAERMDHYVTAQVIHKYELGKSTPGSDVLIHLAKALNVKVEYFFRPDSVDVQLSDPVYRKRFSVSSKYLKSVQAKVKEWVEKYLEVESLFPDNRFPKIKLPDENQRLIKKVADIEELASLPQSLEPWNRSYREPHRSAGRSGVKVVMLEGKGNFDGLSCWANEEIPVILINKDSSGDRQRSSLAHEVGHLIIRVSPSVNEEKAALRFSGAFLGPAEVVYRELGRQRHTIDLEEFNMLKKKYGMSMQQWVYRAKDLSIISESRASELFRLFRERGWNRREPGYVVPSEEPERLKRLILQAVTEGLISPVRAAEILGKPFADFRKLAGELTRRDGA